MAGPQHRTPEYRKARRFIDGQQAAGQWLVCMQPVCLMDTRDIAPTDLTDVGHDESGTVILGPTHRHCNRVDGAWRRQHPELVALQRVKASVRWVL